MDLRSLLDALQRAKDEDPTLLKEIVAHLGLGDAAPAEAAPPRRPSPAPQARRWTNGAAVRRAASVALDHMNDDCIESARRAINTINVDEYRHLGHDPCTIEGGVHKRALARLEKWLFLEEGELVRWLSANDAVIAGGAAVRAVFGDSSDEGIPPLGDVDVWLPSGAAIELPPSWKEGTVTVWNKSTVFLHPDEEGEATPPPLQFIYVENLAGLDPWQRFDYHYCRISVTPEAIRLSGRCLVSNLHETKPAFVGARTLVKSDDIRTTLRAQKATRKGYTLSDTNRVLMEEEIIDKPQVPVLVRAQAEWEETIRADPSDLVAAAKAYDPLNQGRRKLESVVICDGAKAMPAPISLKDYRDE